MQGLAASSKLSLAVVVVVVFLLGMAGAAHGRRKLVSSANDEPCKKMTLYYHDILYDGGNNTANATSEPGHECTVATPPLARLRRVQLHAMHGTRPRLPTSTGSSSRCTAGRSAVHPVPDAGPVPGLPRSVDCAVAGAVYGQYRGQASWSPMQLRVRDQALHQWPGDGAAASNVRVLWSAGAGRGSYIGDSRG